MSLKGSKKWDDPKTQELFQAMLKLRTIDECQRFYRDLCTEEEIVAMADRFQVAKLLTRNMDYRDIADKLKISTTTVGRVAKWLWSGMGGYQLVLSRLGLLHHTTQARGER